MVHRGTVLVLSAEKYLEGTIVGGFGIVIHLTAGSEEIACWSSTLVADIDLLNIQVIGAEQKFLYLKAKLSR